MKYKFKVAQTIYKVVEVEADTESDAFRMVDDNLHEGIIRFDDEPYLDMEYSINAIGQAKSLSAIVVVAEDGAIGRDGGLLCHLPADLRHFKELTMGHSIVMGRRTFESFPKGALPGRQNIVITRNPHWHADGVTVVHDVDVALEVATMPGDIFIIGGAQIYAATFDRVSTLHLTRLHAAFEDADAFFPVIDPDEWEQLDCECHSADDRNPFAYDFITLHRRGT